MARLGPSFPVQKRGPKSLWVSLVFFFSPRFETQTLFSDRVIHAPPPQLDDPHRERKIGGVAYYFAFFLGSDNLHTTPPPKISPGEEGLLWEWCVIRGPLLFFWGPKTHSLRIYHCPMVWPLPRPWSQSPSEHRKPWK